MTMVPPYCGFPNLSHQFPVVTAVDVDVTVVIAVVVVEVWVPVVAGVVVWVVVDVTVDVDVLQDAKSIDVNKRQVITIQIIFLVIYPPLHFYI
jgi:hypothetical protein